MRIKFICEKNRKEELETDVERCLSTTSNPISFTYDIDERDSVDVNGIVETFYNETERRNNQPLVFFSSRYFDLSDENRLLVLLHEFIHIRFGDRELLEWNKQWEQYRRNITREYNLFLNSEQFKEEVWHRMSQKISMIDRLLSQINEMWAELYFRDTYADLFSRRMSLEYDNLKRALETRNYESFGELSKYCYLWEMIRTLFFVKLAITDLPEYRDRFRELYDGWHVKLQQVFDVKSEAFQKLADELTDCAEYPNSKKLENKFIDLANTIWND